jgi:hypothetical protein
MSLYIDVFGVVEGYRFLEFMSKMLIKYLNLP